MGLKVHENGFNPVNSHSYICTWAKKNFNNNIVECFMLQFLIKYVFLKIFHVLFLDFLEPIWIPRIRYHLASKTL